VSPITRIVLGINNCFAVKRWPEPEQWAAVIRENLQMDTVQFSLDLVDLAMSENDLARKAALIRDACKKADIQLHSVFTGLCAYQSNLLLAPDPAERKHWLEWYRKAVMFTAELGCVQVGGHVGALSLADYEDASRREMILQSYADSIHTLSDYAKQAGIRTLLLECMPVSREMTADVDSAIAFHDRTQEASSLPVSLCLDTGHQCAAVNQGAERSFGHWVERLGNRVSMFHLQQNNGEWDQHLAFTPQTQQDGVIHADDILGRISPENNPDLFLEIIPAHEACDRSVLTDLSLSGQYWRQAVDKHCKVYS
jgi:D-erythrulose 1-phosphate 3-epimerase